MLLQWALHFLPLPRRLGCANVTAAAAAAAISIMVDALGTDLLLSIERYHEQKRCCVHWRCDSNNFSHVRDQRLYQQLQLGNNEE